MDGERDEAKEAVIEGAQRRVGAAYSQSAQRKHGRDAKALPLLACIWNSHIDVSIAMRSGRPVSSNFSTASFDRATRFPGPISL